MKNGGYKIEYIFFLYLNGKVYGYEGEMKEKRYQFNLQCLKEIVHDAIAHTLYSIRL